MAETARHSQTELTGSDSGSDMDEDDKINKFVKKVFSKIYDNVLKDLEADKVLDVFQRERVFGDNTTVQVGDLREEAKMSSKNRAIHKYFQANTDKYVAFKSALMRTGQSGLSKRIAIKESEIHDEMKGNHECRCKDASSCPLLKKINCTEYLTQAVASEILQMFEFVGIVFEEMYEQVLENLEPSTVLDVFQAERVFGEKTNVGDLEHLNKKDRNRWIHKYFTANPDKYVAFKSALVTTGQVELLKTTEKTEAEMHRKTKGDEGWCHCTESNSCPLLKKIKCPENLKPFLPRDIKNLQSTLLNLYDERFQLVPLCLLKPTWKHPVRDMYVRQEFKIADHRGKPENSETPEQSCPDTLSLDTIRDIFYNDGKKCKTIYITGEPAVGKSTFCEHLVELWCHAISASESQPTASSEDLQTLSEFKLLFYINLREATIALEAPHSDEIAKLIFEQLDLSEHCSMADIRKYLSDPSTLVVMDSLDELRSKRLPNRGLHNKSCIITTSRPWKLETCRSQLEGDVDKQIEIVGLARDSPKDLAENVIKILNKEFSQTKSSDQFIHKMQTDGLQHLLNIPILVIQMLSLWYDGQSFGNSQYEIYSKMTHYQILAAVKAKELPEYAGKSKLDFPLSCNVDRCPCKSYGELLWKVAKLAYHTLFNENSQVCLVFDHEETTVHGLSAEEVEICLKIGILTQHKLFVKKLTKEKKSVSFLHKTNQEYFASIFLWSLASSDSRKGGRTSSTLNKLAIWKKKKSSPSKDQLSDPQHVFSAITDLDRALEMKEVLLFYCQIDAGISRVLSRIISEKADDDRRVQEYRQSYDIDAPNEYLIENIQTIILQASQQHTKLVLSDISTKKPQWRRYIDDRYLDMAGVTSIHVQYPVDGNTQRALKKTKCLQKFVLSDSGINVESIHEMVLKNKDTLRTLGLYGERWDKLLDLSSLGEKLTEIFNGCQLSSLGLGNVKLSHTQCQIVSRHFSTTNNLRMVTLDDIRCSTHGDSRECLFTLALNNHKQMKKVELSSEWYGRLPISNVRFMVKFMADQLLSCEINLPDNLADQTSALTCLSTLRNLQQLWCRNLKNASSVRELAVVLPHLNALQRIELYKVDFSCLREIRLSAAMEKLEFVELVICSITDEGVKCLVDSLPNQKVKIWLRHVTIRGRENFLQKIRDSSNTDVTVDYNVRYENGGWEVEWFVFYNNK